MHSAVLSPARVSCAGPPTCRLALPSLLARA